MVDEGYTDSEPADDTETQSEIQELFKSCADAVSCLLRLSIAIRKATTRDRYAKAAEARGDPFIEIPDLLHVGQKFPKLKNTPWLENRLGRAITRRRQFLRYCRTHKEKLAEGTLLEVSKPKAPEIDTRLSQPDRARFLDRANEPQQKSEFKIPTILASTKATTLAIPTEGMIPEPPEESDTSTVLSSSLGDGSAVDGLQVPLIPADAAAGLEFECPLCWTIQTFKRKASRCWRYARSPKSDHQ